MISGDNGENTAKGQRPTKHWLAFIHSFICPVYKSNNNSEQTVGQDSKATQDALITAGIN